MPISRIKTDGIQDDAVTSAKIGTSVIIADDLAANSVTVSEIQDGAVTSAKLDTNIDIAGTLDVTGVLTSDSNIRVGTTSDSTTVAGARLKTSGRGDFTADGGTCSIMNRLTNDGDILNFQKEGLALGSIGNTNGSAPGDLYICSNTASHCGISFSGNRYVPTDNTGSYSDNAVDIGESSTRYKDLYLSGGVYLGGTGAANHLDDYEEGSWTPTIDGSTSNPSISYGTVGGAYEKIGNLVHASLFILVNSVSSQGSGQFRIGGLPFTSTSSINASEVPGVFLQTQPFNDGDGSNRWQYARTQSNSNQLLMGYRLLTDGNTIVPSNGAANVGTGYLIGHITYRAS